MDENWRTVRGTRRLFAAALALALFAGPLMASGAYRPPTGPGGAGPNRRELERGQALFSGKEPVGAAARSCASCHDAGAAVPLRRSSLKDNAGNLAELVERCVTHQDRCAAAPDERGGARTVALVAYLVQKFSLPRDALVKQVPRP